MNKVILMGRLTRDPEVRYTQTGKVVCQLTLAVDRPLLIRKAKEKLILLLSLYGVKSLNYAGIVLQRSKGSCRRSFADSQL